MYTDVLMFFWFVVKALFDFIVIWFRMDRFKLLFAEAAELTKESSKETVLKNKKALRRTILAYVMIMTVNLTATVLMMALTPKEFERLHRYLFDESYSPVFEIVGIISFLGGQLCTFVNLITQVFYYSFCLFFITLYEQLEQQILDINDKKKDSSESIKTAVQEHIRIMNMIKSVSHEFREMLVWDFVVYTIILGLILFNSTTSIESMFKLFYLPSIFFGAYIFCYGSYIVSSKGRAMSRMMYMELNWVDMEKKHQKSLLIMMAQFQKRIKIKLMGIKTVDLELFIFVSLNSLNADDFLTCV